MPAVKAHIANSSDPLKEHSDIEAVCKFVVVNAEFVMMWDMKRIKPALEDSEWRGVCRKCVDVPLEKDRVYLIVNGQELKHGEG